jgi:hypothetical protein
MTTSYRVQRDVTPVTLQHGRLWRTEAARGNRAVAERVALNLRTDGRRTARADLQPTYRVVAR